MASIAKHKNGYRAQVAIAGVRESKVFSTKREALEWANVRELEIRKEASTPIKDKFTLLDALRKYANEVSPTHRAGRWEQIRLAAFERRTLPINKLINEVDNDDIARFRDSRLKEIGAGSVLREISLLSSVFEMARIEWRWCERNPTKEIRKPAKPKHREVVYTWTQIKAMLKALGYKTKGKTTSYKEVTGMVFLLALRSGMRAGELCNLEWEHVYENYVHLPITKNGNSRNVPLSKKSKALIERMRGVDDTLVFGMKVQTLDATFRKYRDKAGFSGQFVFHDTRHTAATMLSKKLKVLDLCKMFGWGDPKMAMIYYNPHASTLAELLD